MILAFIIGLLALLIIIGVPIGYSMGLSGLLGLFLIAGPDSVMGILGTSPYRHSSNWILVALPMFILMAELMAFSGIAKKLFRAAYQWLRWLPGGLAVGVIVACGFFGAVSGSSSGASATMARAAAPLMKKYGYDDRMTAGVIATAGSLALMIPPSTALIVYGILTESSIGALFMAGIPAAILTMVVYALVVFAWAYANPSVVGRKSRSPEKVLVHSAAGTTGYTSESDTLEGVGLETVTAGSESFSSEAVTWRTRFQSLWGAWPVLVLFILVMGGIYSGIVTVTEASAAGAGGALLIALFTRSLTREQLVKALVGASKTTAMIFLIIIGAHIFGYFMTLSGATGTAVRWIEGLPLSPMGILIVILAIYIILGFFMDQMAILVLTIPLVYPIVEALGFDAIWFGILIVKTVEIGLATPPLGLNVFITAGASGIPNGVVFRGAARFVLADILVIIFLLFFPGVLDIFMT